MLPYVMSKQNQKKKCKVFCLKYLFQQFKLLFKLGQTKNLTLIAITYYWCTTLDY